MSLMPWVKIPTGTLVILLLIKSLQAPPVIPLVISSKGLAAVECVEVAASQGTSTLPPLLRLLTGGGLWWGSLTGSGAGLPWLW